jgi:tetratricopeptide (TPR) repeat protein/transcriptional regulator with XRE-family HTH domain
MDTGSQPLRPEGAHEQLMRSLRRLRKARGLSQRMLAKPLLLSAHSAIADYESGRRIPPADTLRRYERFFGTRSGELVRLRELAVAERAERDEPADATPLARGPTAVRYSLPPDTAAFIGREEELALIAGPTAPASGPGGVIAIGAIDGMPGVGKTALAVHAAHLLAGRFPDRQLFVSLHGHTPDQDPVAPQDALAGLLTGAGVDPRYLPEDLDGRAALWRDRMSGQRALLVLDNAASSSQVTPLLPGGGGCLVLVTSRRHLGDLPGVVTPVLLGALPPEQAADMFTRLAPHAAASPGQVAQAVALAGFLPLAISLLARVVARHPSWTLADLIREIGADVLTLTAEDASIGAAFGLSYRHLVPGQQRLFCLLGLHPGPAADRYAAAALAGISAERAAGLLDALHAEGLLTETGHRRYGMHDLLRRYARDHAADHADEGQRAVERLLDYYQHTAALADALLARQARPGPAPTTGALPAVPGLRDAGQALSWARAERANLLACLDHATHAGQHARIIGLTAALTELFRCDGPWADAITRHTAAVDAAHHLRDRLGEANALTDLGVVRRLTGEYPGAAQVLERALAIYRDLGDRLGEANALTDLGVVRRLTGEYPGAAQVLERALAIYRDLGDRLGEANALTDLGTVWWLTGEYPGAARALERALAIYRDLGSDRLGEAGALTYLGVVRRMTGEYRGAARVLEQALDIYRDRDIGNPHGEAYALTELGVVRRMTGEYPGAARVLEQALAIYRDLGNRHAEADARTHLGVVRRMTGEYPGAARVLEQALAIYRDLGNRPGEVEALNEQAALHRVGGDLARAQKCHRQALDLARAIGSAWDEACALAGLGRCAMAIGNTAQAEILLRQAHEIFQHIGAAETRDVLAELGTLTGSSGI